MNILLSCAGGMSSSIVAEAIVDEAKKNGNTDIKIHPTGTESVEEDLLKDSYDLILLAPQVAYRKEYIEELAKQQNLQVLTIPGTQYNPLGAGKLYKKIVETLG